jgi:hypothetical protein
MQKIILKNVGRAKVNETHNVAGGTSFEEEDLAEIALRKVRAHLASSNVWLEPDEEKGEGHWRVYVGLGNHVGDVEITKG